MNTLQHFHPSFYGVFLRFPDYTSIKPTNPSPVIGFVDFEDAAGGFFAVFFPFSAQILCNFFSCQQKRSSSLEKTIFEHVPECF